ncbi:MAG: hypothetical protein ABF741_07330 [Liquorilactobacillus ghanensis]|uniref:hypothetical protein n=1 Tax=Liquorilactobacillus ghanensis TaxID=399370 RepID=UPI0039EC244F
MFLYWHKHLNLIIGLFSIFLFLGTTSDVLADDNSRSDVSQTTAPKVLNHSNYGFIVASDLKINVDVVLKPRNEAALENYIDSTVTPGSQQYH